MQQRRAGLQSFADFHQGRAFVPRDRKFFKINLFHSLFLAHDGGDGFPAKSGFPFRKNGLIGGTWNESETIFTGAVLSRKNRVNARMRFEVGAKVSKREARSVVAAANDAEEQRIGWHFVSPKNLRAVDFALAVEANQALTHGGTGEGSDGGRRPSGRGQ